MQPNVARGAARPANVAVEPIQIRGRFLTAVALKVTAPPTEAFYAGLDARLTQTPHFFDDAPVILDLSEAGDELAGGDVIALVEALRSRELAVFGVQEAAEGLAAAARSMGLVALSGGRDAPLRGTARKDPAAAIETRRRAIADREAAKAAPAAAEPVANRVITTPVRSGQTIVAETGDLTVIGNVSSGAELVAMGNIHIYGRLKGRAMAGANGDEKARIFCTDLDAELLAVAGLYRTNENIGPDVRRRSVQIFLEDERLRIEPLG